MSNGVLASILTASHDQLSSAPRVSGSNCECRAEIWVSWYRSESRLLALARSLLQIKIEIQSQTCN